MDQIPEGVTPEQWAAHRRTVTALIFGMQGGHLERVRHGGTVRVPGAPPWEYTMALAGRRLSRHMARERRRAQGARFWDASEDWYDKRVSPELWAMAQQAGWVEQQRETTYRFALQCLDRAQGDAALARLRGRKAEAAAHEGVAERCRKVIAAHEGEQRAPMQGSTLGARVGGCSPDTVAAFVSTIATLAAQLASYFGAGAVAMQLLALSAKVTADIQDWQAGRAATDAVEAINDMIDLVNQILATDVTPGVGSAL